MKDNTEAHNALMEEVIQLEWSQFDRVQNEGGRASCQDDEETFHLMRSAQFSSWPAHLLESYLGDLKEAEAAGWNLITEKYGRMMESTAPEEYEKLKQYFPVLSNERIALQEQIIATEVAWNEEFCAAHPKYAGMGRPIHTSEDTPWATSSETYRRGELSTYSDGTVILYGSWIQSLAKAGQNLAAMTAEALVHGYGYGSVEDAERKLG